MAETRLPVSSNDSLWGIAQSCGIPGGGSNWQALNVERNGTVYDLSNEALPGGLKPGDTVIVPDTLEHSCQQEVDDIEGALDSAPGTASEQGANAQAAAETQSASAVSATATCSTKVIFVLDPGHGGRGARANLASASRLKPYSDALAAGTLSQAEYDAMFDFSDSSWNNAIGAVSNTLEKTMTHKLVPKIRDKLNAQKATVIAANDWLEEVEVHLTKEDEYINLSGKDRAAVARDKAADFFFCCHFNSSTTNISGADVFVRLDITNVQGFVDTANGVNITTIDGGLLGGTYPKTGRSGAADRGPLTLRSNRTVPAAIASAAEIVARDIRTKLAETLQKAESSPNAVGENGEVPKGLANISPLNLGTNSPDKKQIIPVYLEADFINVESGDRLWNTAAYSVNIEASRKRWGIPPEPNDLKERNEWRSEHQRRSLPALPAGHDMFDAAAETIARTLLDNIHHRIC